MNDWQNIPCKYIYFFVSLLSNIMVGLNVSNVMYERLYEIFNTEKSLQIKQKLGVIKSKNKKSKLPINNIKTSTK